MWSKVLFITFGMVVITLHLSQLGESVYIEGLQDFIILVLMIISSFWGKYGLPSLKTMTQSQPSLSHVAREGIVLSFAYSSLLFLLQYSTTLQTLENLQSAFLAKSLIPICYALILMILLFVPNIKTGTINNYQPTLDQKNKRALGSFVIISLLAVYVIKSHGGDLSFFDLPSLLLFSIIPLSISCGLYSCYKGKHSVASDEIFDRANQLSPYLIAMITLSCLIGVSLNIEKLSIYAHSMTTMLFSSLYILLFYLFGIFPNTKKIPYTELLVSCTLIVLSNVTLALMFLKFHS